MVSHKFVISIFAFLEKPLLCFKDVETDFVNAVTIFDNAVRVFDNAVSVFDNAVRGF